MKKITIILFLISLNLFSLGKTEEINCMARAIYFESANQSDLGKIAVGHVILNRMKNANLSACDIVYQKIGNSVQFRWNHKQKTPVHDFRWPHCLELAKNIETFPDPTNGALFFHAKYVNPSWKKKKKFTVKIQDHLFYK